MQLTGNPFSVGLLLSFSAMPGIFLAPIAGALVDSTDGRRIGIISLFLCSLGPTIVVLLFAFGIQIIPTYLYILEFYAAFGYQLYNPSYKVLVRHLSTESSLLSGNASISIANQIGNSAGAMLGGMIVGVFSPYAALAINAGALCLSSILVGLIQTSHCMPKEPNRTLRVTMIARQIIDGSQHLFTTRPLIFVYGILLFVLIEYRLLNAALPSFAKDALNLSADGYGLIQSSFAAGALLGGFLLPFLPAIFGKSRLYLATMLFYGVAILVFSGSSNVFFASIAYFFVGVGFQCWIFLLTKTQEMTPLPIQGRIYGLFTSILSAIATITFISSDLLFSIAGHRYVYIFCGTITVALALIADSLRRRGWIPN